MKTTLSLVTLIMLAVATSVFGGTGTTLTPTGIIFPDGTTQTSAAGSGATPSGTTIISAVNDPATAGVISDSRLSPNVASNRMSTRTS